MFKILKTIKTLSFNRIILSIFLIFSVQAGYGQEPAWNEVLTICTDVYDITAAGMPNSLGQWSVHGGTGSGNFTPDNNRTTSVSGIGVGENWYHYNGSGANEYYIKVIRIEPPVYTLSGPETYCGSVDNINLTLSGSDVDYYYSLYLNGTFFAGTQGTGNPIIWTTDQTGIYTSEAEHLATINCNVIMDGQVDVIISPLPAIYQLDAPTGTDFCAGSDANLTLNDSDIGISYQLYLGTEAYGSPRGGTGDPISWNVTEEGSYHVVATDNISGCQETMDGTIALTELPAPAQYDLSPASASYCGESGGTITLPLAGSQPNVSYQLLRYGTDVTGGLKAGDGGTLEWNISLYGTYTVRATDDMNNCVSYMNNSSVITRLGKFNISSSASYYCEGEDGVTLTLSGSQTGVNYRLHKNGFFNSSKPGTGNSLNWQNVKEGLYQVYARKDGVDCLMGELTVTVITFGANLIDPVSPVCKGESAQLKATGGEFYLWEPSESLSNNTIADPVATPPATTTYTVTITDEYGCSATESVTVTVSSLPVANAGADKTICIGSSAQLNATGGTSYQWSPAEGLSETDIANPFASPNSTTEYTVTVFNNEGCISNDKMTVIVNPAPSVNAGPDYSEPDASICEGEDIGLEVTGDAESYVWSTGETTGNILVSPINTTTYTVTGTYTATGCTTTDNITVTVNSLPSQFSVTGGGEFCEGTGGLPVGLTGSENGVNYRLYLNGNDEGPTVAGTGSAIQFGNINKAGIYTIIAMNSTTTCTAEMAGDVELIKNLLPGPAQSITGNKSVCPGSTVNYSVPEIPGAESYLWTLPPNAGITGGNGTRNISVSYPTNAGTGIISVKGVNACGEGTLSSSDITVRPLPLPAGIITGEPNVCEGALNNMYSIEPVANATSYQWTIPSGAVLYSSSVDGTEIIVDYPEGSVSGDITVTPVNSCGTGEAEVFPVTVTPLPNLTVTAPADELDCSGNTLILSASSSTAGVTWSWTAHEGGNIVSGSDTDQPEVDMPGTYRVSATTGVCSTKGEVKVTRNTDAPQDISITKSDPEISCNIPEMTLTASTSSTFGVSYSWSASGGGSIVSGANTATPLIDRGGYYTVTAKNIETSCSATPVTITINEDSAPPDLSTLDILVSGDITCVINEVQLSTDPPLTGSFVWSSNDGNIDNPYSPTPMVDATGIYKVTVTGDNGCSAEKPIQVFPDYRIPENVWVDMNPGTINCLDTEVELEGYSSTTGVEYMWTGPGVISGENTNTPMVNLPGTYTMTVTHPESGCTDQATVIVIEDKVIPSVNFPNQPDDITCDNTSVQVESQTSATNPLFEWFDGSNQLITGQTTGTLTTTESGTYTLRITDQSNHCQAENSITVGEDINPPGALVVPPATITCSDQEITLNGSSPTAGVAKLWTTIDGFIKSGSTTFNPVVTAAGTYKLTVTNPVNGCTSEATAIVAEDKEPPVIVNFTTNPDALSCKNTQSELSGTASGSTLLWTGPAGATISDPAATPTFVDTPGIYRLTATNIDNGCEAFRETEVTMLVDKPADVIIQPFDDLSCANGSTTLTATSSTSNVSFRWEAGAGGVILSDPEHETITVGAAATYTVFLAHPATGCEEEASAQVEHLSATPTITLPAELPEKITCNNLFSGVQLNASVDPPVSELLWEGPGTIDNNTTANPNVYVPGIYTLTATHSITGCISVRSIEVKSDMIEPVIISFNAPGAVTCDNPEITIDPVLSGGSYSYMWSEGSADATIIGSVTNKAVVVTSGGTYTLTVTDNGNGCKITGSVEVDQNTVNPDIFVDSDPANITCKDDLSVLYGTSTTAGATYLWNGPGNITDAATETPKVDLVGTYTLTVTDPANGCKISAGITVGENKVPPVEPQILTPNELSCNNEWTQLQVSPFIDGVDYSWTTTDGGTIINGSTDKASVNAPGTYVVTITDRINGCTSQNSIEVTRDEDVSGVAITGQPYQLSCATGSLTITGNTPDGTDPVWTTTGGNIISDRYQIDAEVNAPGDYTLTVHHPVSGCQSSATVSVGYTEDVPLIDVNSFPGKITCVTSTVQLYGAPEDLSHDFAWSTTDGNIVSGEDGYNPVVDQPGTYVITVTNPITGCSNQAGIIVEEDKLAATFSIAEPGDFACLTDYVQLEATVTSADTDVSYAWTTSGGGTIWPGDENDANPRVTSAGTYTLTVTKISNQCTSSKVVIVGEEITAPHITTDNNPNTLTCERAEVILSGSSDTENAEFKWTSPDGHTIYNSGTKNPRVTQPGTYILTVTDPANGCTASSGVTVIQNIVAPHIHIEPDPQVLTCNVTSVMLEGDSNTGDVSYSWSGPVPVVNPGSKVVYVTEPGRYYLTVTRNATGCTSTDYVDVLQDTEVPAAPPADDAYTCFGGGPASLESTGTNIRWYDHSNLEAGALIREGGTYTPTVTATGNYYFYVTQTESNGCESPSTQVKYTIKDLPSSPAVENKEICEGGPNPQLRAYGINISWYESVGGPVLSTGEYYTPDPSVNAPGTYIYYASQTDAHGCESNLTEVTLIIRAQPAAPVITENYLESCAGEPNPAFTASGKNILWYGSATATNHLYSGNEFTPTAVNQGSYNFYVSQTSDYGCESDRATATLTINDIPDKFDITGGGVFCENTAGVPVGLGNSEAGVEYTLWLDQSTITGIATGTGGSINFGYKDIAGTYRVTATGANGCSTEMNGAVSVQVNYLPAKPGIISGQKNVCQGSTSLTYSVLPVEGASSYIWELPPGVQVSSGLGTNSITADFTATAQSGAVRVRAVNHCGDGPVSDDVYVTINNLPAAAGNIIATPFNTQACRGDADIIFEVPEAINATGYQWQLPAGASIVQGEGTRMIKVRFAPIAATGNQMVRVRGINGCGTGEYSDLHTVTVYAPPYVSAGIEQQLCSDQTMLAGSEIPAGGTALWETVAGYAVFTNTSVPDPSLGSLAMGENTFVYTVTHEACSVSDTVRIYNNKVIVDAGDDRVICNEVINLEGSDLPAGTTGLWSVGAGSVSFENATVKNTSAYNFKAGDNKLYWSVNKNGCISRDSVIITNHRPVDADAGYDLSTCNGEAWPEALEPAVGQGEWSVISGRAEFDDISDPNSRIYGLDRGINTLAWVVSNFSCSLADTITVTNLEAEISAGEDQELCDSRTILDATIPPDGGSGEWSVLRGAATIDNNADHLSRVSGLARGVNELLWTVVTGGCVIQDVVSLTNNMPTAANSGADQEITVDFTQLEANLPVVGSGMWTVISGSGTFNDPTLNTATVTNLAPGPNTLRWTISNENCHSSSDVLINNGSVESVYAGEDLVICIDETSMNASEPPFGYGKWTVRKGSARFENNEQADTRVYDLGRGENILRWSITIGSTEYFDELTIINNMPSDASAGSDRSLCSDSFILTGNEPIVGTGIWTIEGGSAEISDHSLYNTPVSGMARGPNIFRWTISNENCVSSDIVVIANDIPTTPDAGPDQSSCSGTAELYPNTPTIGTGEWSVLSGAGSFEGNYVSELANGENRLQYSIINNQCILSDEVIITNHKPTTADAGYNIGVCSDLVELNANQPNTAIGETGQWTVINGSGIFDDASMANAVVTGLASGRNVFRWSIDNQGCVSYDEIEVSYDFIEADAGRDIITCDEEIVLNANNPGNGNGEWSVLGGSGSAVFENPSSPSTRVTNLDQGNNILRWTITNNRCISWDEISVRNNSPSIAYAGADQSLCEDTVQLQARDPLIGNGSWSVVNGSGHFDEEGAYNTIVHAIATGSNTYRWTVENEGCFSSDEVVISNDQPRNTFAGADQILCDDQAVLTANEPDTGEGVWSIIQGAGVLENAYSNITPVSNLAPGDNILRWTVSNKQCSEYSDVKLINHKPTTALAGADRTICNDQTVLEGNIPLQGDGRWSVISGSGTFSDQSSFNSSVSGLSRGRNILRWTITKENCSSSGVVTIHNDMPSKPDAGADIVVCGNTSPLNGNMPAVGTGEWSLVSGSGDFDDPSRYNTTIRGLGQGNNVVRWTITNNNCSLSDQVEIRNNVTDVYAGPDQIIYTSTTKLSANIPTRGTGFWSVDAGEGKIISPSSAETSVEGLYEGANTFRWSVNIDGCISSDDVMVTYYRQPTASYAVNTSEGCPPLEVRFTKTTTEDYSFRWELGDNGTASLEENPVYIYENPGRYVSRLFVTGPDGKEVMSEKVITVHEPPVTSFELAPTELYIPGNELRTYNYSTNSSIFFWDFGDGNTSGEINPVHTYLTEGSFYVSLRVMSAEGCSDSLTYHEPVNVTTKTSIKFPSAFTPNQQGPGGGRYDRKDFTNHVFYPVVINGTIDNYLLEIYNRWGVLIFKSNDIEIGWDGYYKGQAAAEDVYIFRVSGILNNGEKFSDSGDFLLMRRQ